MNISLKSPDISQNHLNLLYHPKTSIPAKITTLKFTPAISCVIAQINDQIKKKKAENESTRSASAKEFLNTAKIQLLQTYEINNQSEILKALDHIAHAIKNTQKSEKKLDKIIVSNQETNQLLQKLIKSSTQQISKISHKEVNQSIHLNQVNSAKSQTYAQITAKQNSATWQTVEKNAKTSIKSNAKAEIKAEYKAKRVVVETSQNLDQLDFKPMEIRAKINQALQNA